MICAGISWSGSRDSSVLYGQIQPCKYRRALGKATLVAAVTLHYYLDVDSCSALRYSSTLLLSTNVDPVSTNVGKGENEFGA